MAQDQFIKDWLEGKISPEELKKAKEEGQSIEELERIVEESARLNVPESKTKEQAWDDFMTKIEPAEQPTKVRKLNPIWPIAIAATVALAVVTYVFIFSDTTIYTKPGNRLTHTLPDGSEITLNAASTITYNLFNWQSNRSVQLDGEAFFEVENGNDFKVVGKDATISVLGTSFNAFFRDGESQVACFEGSVSVKSTSGKGVTLKKGEATTDLTHVTSFDAEKNAAWTEGEFYFENQPLTRVIKELERQYAITIEFDQSGDRLYTGYFNDQDLHEALQLVFKPMGLSFQIKEDKIIVK